MSEKVLETFDELLLLERFFPPRLWRFRLSPICLHKLVINEVCKTSHRILRSFWLNSARRLLIARLNRSVGRISGTNVSSSDDEEEDEDSDP